MWMKSSRVSAIVYDIDNVIIKHLLGYLFGNCWSMLQGRRSENVLDQVYVTPD